MHTSMQRFFSIRIVAGNARTSLSFLEKPNTCLQLFGSLLYANALRHSCSLYCIHIAC